MATTRTYTVGERGTVYRMENQDPSTWTNVSLNSLIGSINPIWTQEITTIETWWLNNIHLVDVMTDPNDSAKLCTISGTLPNSSFVSPGSGFSCIFISHTGGNSWFTPGGNWVTLCNQTASLCRNIFEVWYADSDTIYIIAENGYIFRSVDGGLNFNYLEDQSNNPIQAGAGNQYTTAIHMWKDTTGINGGLDYGVIAQQEDLLQIDSDVTVWKTLDEGHTWTKLNSSNAANNNALENTVLSNQALGVPGGVYISQDQSIVTVECQYVTNRSIDDGYSFDTTLQTTRSAHHLTWLDTYGIYSMDQWVTGKLADTVENTTDGGLTWVNKSNTNTSPIFGAHFYEQTSGYLVYDNRVYETTDSGITHNLILTLSGKPGPLLLAIWTTIETPLYELIDCGGSQSNIVVQPVGPILDPYVIDPANPTDVTIQITGNPLIPSTACWQVFETSLTIPDATIDGTNTIIIYDTCQGCLPPPPSTECWRLIACSESTSDTCATVYNHTGFDFTLWQNQWIWINGDTTCAYKPIRVREATFCALDQTSALSGAFTDITYTVTSLILNGVQYITGAPVAFTMTVANYDPVECTGLSCVSVAVGTTENSYSNFATYLNTIFAANTATLNILEAYPNDPLNTIGSIPTSESFRVQYSDGDEFQIIIERVQGASTTYSTVEVLPGNTSNAYLDSIELTDCTDNTNTLCTDTTTVPVIDPDIPIVITDCEKAACTLTATYTSTDITVNGGSDGTITLNINGAQSPLFILWSTGATNVQTLTGLSAGIYSVTISDTDIENCEVHLTIILTEPPPAPDLSCEPVPRLGEPGFSTRYCDPKQVIKIKSQFADSLYALFKRIRFGIETCCEFDLDKIDTKHQLLELGELLDPDACQVTCYSYNVTAVDPDATTKIEYIDCFGAKVLIIIDPISNPSPTFCAQLNTIVNLGSFEIVITLIEECCDPVQTINMKYYCVSLITADTTGVILWFDYEGLVKRKTLTTIEGSCGPDGVDKMYVCAQEGTVTPYPPLLITDLDITEMGSC